MSGYRIQILLFFLVFSAIMPVEAPGAERGKPVVAVMPMEDETGTYSEQTLRRATDYLRSGVAAAEGVVVVEESRQNSKLEQIIDKKKRESYRECYDDDCQIPLGKALAADTILRAKVNRLDRCILSLTLVDLAKEATVDGTKEAIECREEGSVGHLRAAIDRGLGRLFRVNASTAPVASLDSDDSDKWSPEPMEKRYVEFVSTPSSAVVYVDGRMVCSATPCSGLVPKRVSSVVMQKEMYRSKSKEVDLAEPETVRFELVPTFGSLTIESEADNINVAINGEDAGKLPLLEKRLSPGTYKIQMTSKCFATARREVNIKRGELTRIDLDMEPLMAGIKILAENPEGEPLQARVYVDGDKKGRSPGVFKVSACAEQLAVTANGYRDWRKSISLEPRETVTLKPKLTREISELVPDEPETSDAGEASSSPTNNSSDGRADWLKSDEELMSEQQKANAENEESDPAPTGHGIIALHLGLGGQGNGAWAALSGAAGGRFNVAQEKAIGMALEIGTVAGDASNGDIDECDGEMCNVRTTYFIPRFDLAFDKNVVLFTGLGGSVYTNEHKDKEDISYARSSLAFQYGFGVHAAPRDDNSSGAQKSGLPMCFQFLGRTTPALEDASQFWGVRFGMGYC